jgi:hypothetical protein
LSALARRLWVLYRITPKEQERIEAFQVSHDAFRLLLGHRMGTDHDHKTGLIRGRLDWRINKALGHFERVATGPKLAEIFRALALYVEQPPAITALGGPRYGLIGLAKYKKKMVYGPPEAI